MAELLIGCGNSRRKCMALPGRERWNQLVTLDRSPACEPDVVWDLEQLGYPFGDEQFEEIHAYDVLEHTGRQGDWQFFFRQWSEFHRMLTPGGYFFGIVPMWNSPWAWGDPSHTRIVSLEQLTFLDQDSYAQVGTTAMTDFREVYRGNFKLRHSEVTSDQRQVFILQKVSHPCPSTTSSTETFSTRSS